MPSPDATTGRIPGGPPHEIVPQKRRPPPCNRASADNRAHAAAPSTPPTAGGRQQDNGAERGGRVHMLRIMRYIRYRHPVLFARDAGPPYAGSQHLRCPSNGADKRGRKNFIAKKAFLFGRFKILIYFCTTSVKKCCCSSVVEHFLGKEEVTSSILVNSSRNQAVAKTRQPLFSCIYGKKGMIRSGFSPAFLPESDG